MVVVFEIVVVFVVVAVVPVVEARVVTLLEAEIVTVTGEVVATAALAVTRHSTPASVHVEKLWPLDVYPTVYCDER